MKKAPPMPPPTAPTTIRTNIILVSGYVKRWLVKNETKHEGSLRDPYEQKHIKKTLHEKRRRKERNCEQTGEHGNSDRSHSYLEILCWIILAVASLSMRIVGCSIPITQIQNELTSSVDHLAEFLLVFCQTLLRISYLSITLYNFLLNGMLINIYTLALQIGYE